MQYRIKVSRDNYPENPRTAWDNVATMVCWHGRYTLGDEQPKCTPGEYRQGMAADHGLDLECSDCGGRGYGGKNLRNANLGADDDCLTCEGSGEVSDETIEKYIDEHFWILPLYLYDHSGITISTGPFSCPWDSGQVGFIYVSMERAREEWGTPPEGKVEHEFYEERMRHEVKVYDQYLTGDVYRFELERARGYRKEYDDGDAVEGHDWEDVDSCWGFFGDDPKTNGMAEHLDPGMLEALREAAHYSNNDEWVEFELPGGDE